ncbi:hypothetical protein JAAARDRAFT_206225 [Jaapia argillacea MUCL 33604]|uniref:Fe2OG dioxygenase domain-containing protein n=1 Tax=Jaapia argillacea MUCL 33604 TaxID=933084 RepID=A0A067PWW0_9AGAM|nr:hypothetical protein JAAARDRAFT_206225 [Jaapia argillacea MUCL 33604]
MPGVHLTPNEVPLVDFSAFSSHGTVEEQKTAAEALLKAFRNVGFVYLTGHGVPEELVDETFAWSKKMFDLPYETKMLAPHPEDGAYHRGYSGLGREKVTQMDPTTQKGELASRKVPDVKENYEIGNDTDTALPNIWLPDDALPGFRPFMSSFFNRMTELARQLHLALAVGLGLPDTQTLLKAHLLERYQLRLLHYPPVSIKELRKGEKERIGAHTDFGTFTFLFQDSVGGLEVASLTNPDVFLPVKPIPGTVLVNVGDMLQRWTNDQLRSTMHRVRAPPPSDGEGEVTRARYSIPFFIGPDPGTIVQCLPGCEGEGGAKYEPVDCMEWIMERLRATY